MNNCVENFSSYTTNAQANYYYPTPVYANGYTHMNGVRSPPLMYGSQMYSPLCRVQVPQYGYERMQSASPAINLIPCEILEEGDLEIEDEVELTKQCSKLSLTSKLSYKSKAFVKKPASDSKGRKASQDTKAHSEDEGNTSDDCDEHKKIKSPKALPSTNPYIGNYDMSSPKQDFTSLSKVPSAFQEKFKTELCKNWQVGNCKFGLKCAFAHGEHELSEKKYLPSNYKTKICKQFHEELYCSYGTRCQFIHLEETTQQDTSAVAAAVYTLVGLPVRTKATNGRLPIFKELAN